MDWAFPLVVFAIVVATGPVIYMTYHSIRYGHHPSPPVGGDRRTSIADRTTSPLVADPEQFGWTVCPDCKAVVVDAARHVGAVHEREYAPA